MPCNQLRLIFFTLKNFRIDQPEKIPANLQWLLLHSDGLHECAIYRNEKPIKHIE